MFGILIIIQWHSFIGFSEIQQTFDAISYYKGANVIRMLSTFLGEEVFLAGVRRYLKEYEYGNASTDNLWEALSIESGNDVGRLMEIWTRRPGASIIICLFTFKARFDSFTILIIL